MSDVGAADFVGDEVLVVVAFEELVAVFEVCSDDKSGAFVKVELKFWFQGEGCSGCCSVFDVVFVGLYASWFVVKVGEEPVFGEGDVMIVEGDRVGEVVEFEGGALAVDLVVVAFAVGDGSFGDAVEVDGVVVEE